MIGGARPEGGTGGYPDVGGNRGQYEDGSPLTYRDLMMKRLAAGGFGNGMPSAAPVPGGPAGPNAIGGGSQINPQLLMAILQMLAQKGGMPGSAPPPGVPPMGMMPNRPPGAM